MLSKSNIQDIEKLYANKIPGKIREMRKEKGLTQAELADLLDVKRETVIQWEKGQRNPHLSYLIALSNIFGCSLDTLTGRIDCKNHDLQFIHDYTGLSEDAINKLHSFAEPFDENKKYNELKKAGFPEEILKDLKHKHETSLEREYNDILSLLIEDLSYEYLIMLIASKIKMKKPTTPKERLSNDIWIEGILPDGTSVVVDKRNLFDNLIMAQLPLTLSAISEVYHSSNSDH